MSEYDKVGVILRASPAHLGHKLLIQEALNKSRDEVVVLVGSSRSAPTIKNPFDVNTRINLLREMFTTSELVRIRFCPLPDDLYNMERWIGRVQEAMGADYSDDVAIISSSKDRDDAKRLEWCPFWDHVSVKEIPNLNATDIRTILLSENGCHPDKPGLLFSDNPERDFKIPKSTQSYLREYVNTGSYVDMVEEWEYIRAYKDKQIQALKSGAIDYPFMYNTVDAVVICAGHFLLIRRGGAVGKNLLAFPGGFLNPNETQLEGAIRELKEETKIDLPKKILESNVQIIKTFDHPERSNLGRLITQAHIIHLPPQLKTANGIDITKNGKDRLYHGMPRIKAADDAKEVMWLPIYKFKQLANQMHDDHYDIGIYARDRVNSTYR